MKEPKILIYRFLERYDGTSPEPLDSYDPRQLGGQVPAVGDLIIDPGAPEGWDRRNRKPGASTRSPLDTFGRLRTAGMSALPWWSGHARGGGRK
jgi:hypothetical protein